jgi:hypothetical protein
MNDLLVRFLQTCTEYAVEASAKELLNMAEIKGNVNGKFLTKILNQEDFFRQCKKSYVGYKDSRLEFVISSPGYEPITIEDKTMLEFEGFRKSGEKQKTISLKYANGTIAKLILNPADDLNQYFRLEFSNKII